MDGYSGYKRNVQGLDLFPELTFLQVEVGSGLGDVPSVPHQDPVDVPSVEPLPGLFQGPAFPAFKEPGEVLELACLDEEGKVGGGDEVLGNHDDEPLDDIHQLADIPRPDVAQERSDGLRGHRLGLLPVFHGEMPEEVVDQMGDIIGAFSQGRQGEGDDIELKEKVFAEASPCAELSQTRGR